MMPPDKSPKPRLESRPMRLALLLALTFALLGTIRTAWQLAPLERPLKELPAAHGDHALTPHGFLDLQLTLSPARAQKIVTRWATVEQSDSDFSLWGRVDYYLTLHFRSVALLSLLITALCLLVAPPFVRTRQNAWIAVTTLPALAVLLDFPAQRLLTQLTSGDFQHARLLFLLTLAKILLLTAPLPALITIGLSRVARLLNATRNPSAALPLQDVVASERKYLRQRRQIAGLPSRDANIGLALSGGGLRSATISLGVLQAFARRRLLAHFDYLSTVSGGGYIGAALSSLLSINGAKLAESPRGSRDQYTFKETDEPAFSTEPERFPFLEGNEAYFHRAAGFGGSTQVKHLREAGHLLIANRRLFSIDMLRTMGGVIGGLIYHLMHFLLLLVAVAASYLWLLYVTVGAWATANPPRSYPLDQPLPISMLYSELVREALGLDWGQAERLHPYLLAFLAGFFFTALTMLMIHIAIRGSPDTWFERPGRSPESVRDRVAILATLLIMLTLGVTLSNWIRLALPQSLLTVGAPLASYLGGASYMLIAMGWVNVHEHYGRRDRTRVAAHAGTLFFLVLYSSILLCSILVFITFFDLLTVYLEERPLRTLLVSLLLLLSALFFGGRSWTESAPQPRVLSRVAAAGCGIAALLLPFLLVCGRIWRVEPPGAEGEFRLTLAFTALLLFVLTGYLNFDKLSLHFLYRDRLAEAFLQTRQDVPEAGFAKLLVRDNETLLLSDMHGRRRRGLQRTCVTSAPLHLIVSCLNLSTGRRRKTAVATTEQFIFSRLFCGSERTGHVDSTDYRGGRTRLSDAMTISAAAVSAAFSAASTPFNVRLGRWLENPRFFGGTRPRATFWPLYLFRELFASSNVEGRLVYLSDGGHSGDNLGIYPLLKRGCPLIVAVDAEHDPTYSCSSLCKALARIGIEEKVRVAIDLDSLRPDPATGYSGDHCAFGRIDYGSHTGWLVVLKSSMTGDEQAVIESYRQRQKSFPHQTTADLFFDWEQFEANRLLGEHMGEKLADYLIDIEAPWAGDLVFSRDPRG